MATKTLNTRLQLKYDTLANWTSNNPVLLKGEMAVATVDTATSNIYTVPTVVVKVGDGVTAYNSLPFVSAAAADVYEWAKASTKPTYAASEITGLADYIAGKVADTDTQYQIVKVSSTDAGTVSFKLQSKALGSTTWTDVDTFTWTIPTYDDTSLKASVSANTSSISAIKDGSSIDSFKDVETALAKKQDSGSYATTSSVTALETKVTTLIGTTTGDDSKSARTIASEEVAKIVAGADESYDTLKEIADWISSHATDAASMNSAITANTNNITALTTRVKTAEGEIDTLQFTVDGLADIATSGNVNDLIQTSGDTLIFDCGSSAL